MMWQACQRPWIWFVQFWPAITVAFFMSLCATAFCRSLALQCGIVDKPDDLVKTHKQPIAYLGGVGILAGWMVGVWCAVLGVTNGVTSAGLFWLGMITAGALAACAVGVVDDLLDLTPGRKVTGQFFAATLLVLGGIHPQINWLGCESGEGLSWILNSLLVYIIVLGATNALNLLDGLDGLCAGVTSIITLGLLCLAVLGAQFIPNDTMDTVLMVLCLGLLGSVLGFIPYNKHPATIFMGDAGSLLLGYCVAVIMILLTRNVHQALCLMILFGLPLLDTGVAMVRRWINHRPLFVSDRGHVYDQMMDRGFNLKRTVLSCYGLSVLYAMIGIFMSLVSLPWALGIAGFVIVISGIIVQSKGYLKMEGLRGALQK